MENFAIYVFAPIIWGIVFLVGLAKGRRDFLLGGAICLGGWLLFVLSESGSGEGISESAKSIGAKIIIGVVCSVIAGIIVKLIFSRRH